MLPEKQKISLSFFDTNDKESESMVCETIS